MLANSPDAGWLLLLCLLCDYLWIVITYVRRKTFIYWKEGEGWGPASSPGGKPGGHWQGFPEPQAGEGPNLKRREGKISKSHEHELWSCPVPAPAHVVSKFTKPHQGQMWLVCVECICSCIHVHAPTHTRSKQETKCVTWGWMFGKECVMPEALDWYLVCYT